MTGDREQVCDWLQNAMATSEGDSLGEGYQAAVRSFDSPFGRLVVKRPHKSMLLGRAAKRSVIREHRVYERLEGIRGIPRSFGLIGGNCLALEHIQGPSLRAYEARMADREKFFALLLETIDAMHAAGVAHGDLKRKDNIIVGPDEEPYVIDFGIACVRDGGKLNRLWFAWVSQMDYNAWTKLKYGRNRENMSPEDAERYKPLLLERCARWIRVPWQKITMRRLRQAWRKRRSPAERR